MALMRTQKHGYGKKEQRIAQIKTASKLRTTPPKPKKEPKKYPHSSEKQRERYCRQGYGSLAARERDASLS